MKLSHQTGLALLMCSLAGLALAVALGRGWSKIEQAAGELGPNSVALRDADHLEASINQWFVTTDLVFVDGQSYLAEGVSEQAAGLTQVLENLAATTLARGVQDDLADAAKQIETIAQAVNRSAMGSPQDRDENLNDAIAVSDAAATVLIERIEQIRTRMAASSQQAVAGLSAQRDRFKSVVAGCAAIYLLLIALVWRWMTISVVRPVVRLTSAAGQAASSVEAFAIAERGPAEIRQLTRDIGGFVNKLDAQRSQADAAAARVQAVMDAAPDAIVTINSEGKIATFNDAALTLFALDRDALQGHDASALLPDYLEALRGEAGLNGTAAETPAFRGDGAAFPADLSISEVGLGGELYYTAVLRDITARKANEAEVKRLNDQLVDTSRQAGMAEIASGVLHNVGNVLTSVNVTATSLNDRIRGSKLSGLHKAVELMDAHADDLPRFIGDDPKGQKLPLFLGKIAGLLGQEQEALKDEVGGLIKSIDHIKAVVASQQSVARVQNAAEAVSADDLLDDAVDVNRLRLEKFGVEIEREVADLPPLRVDRHKTMQILVNLVKNACDAMERCDNGARHLTLTATRLDGETARISVGDSGVGIDPENLARVFNHGFTTKADGHGFGLHSSANTAQQMGGSLTVVSDGPGCGATFHLDLPAPVQTPQTEEAQ